MTDIERSTEIRTAQDFAAIASHQIRTPLSGVKWLLELAARDQAVGEETRSYIADARDATERLIRLVNELLTVSRLESGRVVLNGDPVALDGVTGSVLDEVARRVRDKDLRLSTVGLAGVPAVTGDSHLVRQVILTLVSNAITYTAEGGMVTISLGADAGAITWTIRDSGIGIPVEAQGRVFEKFFRADNALAVNTEGIGLGLALSKLAVERLGGQIGFESVAGRGSVFTFTLPIAR